MGRRRTPLAAAILIGLTALAGCAHPQIRDAGDVAALPDPAALVTVQAQQFDKYRALMDKALVKATPIKGTMFKTATFGAKSEQGEWDVEFVGKPPALFVRARTLASKPGETIDTVHPAGSKYDYLLLGKYYAGIAPTPWIRLPTSLDAPVNVCLITGYQQICDIEDTLTFTEREGVHLTKRVAHNPDGTVTLTTGVTLKSLLKDNFLLTIPQTIQSQFTPAMLAHQIPTTFVLSAQGAPQIVEISGVVPGPTPLVVQVGYQITGTATMADIPPPPDPGDVTAMTNAEFNKAFDKVAKEHGS